MKQTQLINSLQLIRCNIGDENYCIDMSWVQSIQRTDRIQPNKSKRSTSELYTSDTKKHPAHVGWLPEIGHDIPVFDLESILGISKNTTAKPVNPPRSAGTQRIVVLHPPHAHDKEDAENDKTSWGLIVDRISQIIQFPIDQIMPLPPIAVNPTANYFVGVVIIDEELVLCLSPDHLHQEVNQDPKFTVVCIEDVSPHSGIIRKRTTAEKVENLNIKQDGGHKRIVTFSIPESYAEERALTFGLSISQVPEILESLSMIRVPAAPEYVLGLLNWRERPIPLIDLAKRLGWSHEQKNDSNNGTTRLIIVRDTAQEALAISSPGSSRTMAQPRNNLAATTLGAFLIQPTIRVLRLPIEYQPGERNVPFDQAMTRCIVELQDETLVIPDIAEIFSRNE